MENCHASLYYVIPAQVFEDDRLEFSEIMFYGLLSGLAFSNGYCFASDRYLGKRMKSDERTIRRWIEKLEGFGYIKRHTEKNGMKWDRKIFICHSSTNVYERASSSLSNGHTCPDREGAHARIVSKEEEEETATPSQIVHNSPPTQAELEELQRRKKARRGTPIVDEEKWNAATLKSIRRSKPMSQRDRNQKVLQGISQEAKLYPERFFGKISAHLDSGLTVMLTLILPNGNKRYADLAMPEKELLAEIATWRK